MSVPLARTFALAIVMVTAACSRHRLDVLPEPLPPDPEFRIGIAVDVPRLTAGGGGPLRITEPGQGTVGEIAARTTAEITPNGTGVVLVTAGRRSERALVRLESADTSGVVRLNGRDYRGVVEVRAVDRGLVAINLVGLERYLAGVTGAELGRRTPEEVAALRAQAVVSRTYALKNQGRWRTRGFDLLADVSDQAYAGQQGENPLVVEAVKSTRGEVLMYHGEIIDAFYSSTCGGHTEDGRDVFSGGDRSYLRSVSDLDPDGRPWCAISPRFRWNASWTAGELAATLARTLPNIGTPPPVGLELGEVSVLEKSRTGRIASVELRWGGTRTVVSGQSIRRVFAPAEGGLLRSTAFTIRIARTGGRIERIEMDGRGNGHAVGMCQWGAIGRARGGQDYTRILASYFPGTELRRAY